MIMHRVNGTILLVGSMLCYAISGLLGALQPPGTIYWAMSFPAMRIISLYEVDASNWRDWSGYEQRYRQHVCNE